MKIPGGTKSLDISVDKKRPECLTGESGAATANCAAICRHALRVLWAVEALAGADLAPRAREAVAAGADGVVVGSLVEAVAVVEAVAGLAGVSPGLQD